MNIPFSKISDESRIWIYQSDRKFSVAERAIIETDLRLFTERWTAHGHALETSFDIRYDQFIIIAVNESHYSASGCSIDESFRAIQALAVKLNCDFFNRGLVGFLIDQNVVLIPQPALKKSFQDGLLTQSTLTFNNVIATKTEVENNWLTPSGRTWLKRYVPAEKMATN